jgi:Family of unknown function (DUF5947)
VKAGEEAPGPLSGDAAAVVDRLKSLLHRPRSRPAARPEAEERCELCGVPIAPDHRHLVNLETRSLLCACRPCGLLFTLGGTAGGRYRTIPERYLRLAGFALSDAQWETLQIPVSIAFFFYNSALQATAAFYPSPAGATESLLPLETWEDLSRRNPIVASLEPDVEALLVRKPEAAGGFESFVVPIDACYELVGRIRRNWRGFEGGEEARREIETFFAGLRERSGVA